MTPFVTLPEPLNTWSPLALAGVALFAVVSLSLLVTALAVWWRTHEGEMPAPGRWVWLPLFLLQVIGPLTFLLLRRRTAIDARARRELAAREAHRLESSANVADLLYGESPNTRHG